MIVVAQLLATSLEGVEPRDLPATTLALAEARTTYAETLDRSDYREDAPAMRALAETVTPLLVDAWQRHPTLRSQAVELMRAIAGDGLRPFLDAIPGMLFALARP